MFRMAIGILIAWPWGVVAQEFSLGEPKTLADPRPGLPIYKFCPDGHIAAFKDDSGWQMYWAGSTSYRTHGPSILASEDPQVVLRPGPKNSHDNGGAWLCSVFRDGDQRLIGFYHAEDQEFSAKPSSRFIAWKSICHCTSSDHGKTWEKGGQIITSSSTKPAKPTWGGCGDFCIVWDPNEKCWVCFYQEHFLHVAMSREHDGKPGTWKKYFDGKFEEPGLGGRQTPIPGLEDHAGGNPSVHFNTFLDRWVMVWATWDQSSPHPNSIWMSTSSDLQKWASPK